MNPTDNPIISAVISKLNAQQEKGLAKYGQPVQVNAYDLRGWLQHALEETLDHAVYLEAAIQTLDDNQIIKGFNEMKSHELIMKIRERHQMAIYSSNEQWCVQLFELDICPNDIGISCEFETSDESLHDALTEALEWSSDRQ
ncbi:hypothetical protein P8883_07305 [Bacillus atrophaeus]|uniref:hypothetical protein n=1 Tax=Bacillus atrophaeus TaxID=1452 RepID=UPI002DB64B2C|nr:hypothetical protein [Bacillus atrophaeus]MEC0804083.1 hypothetical protein [Bacillus atrophaeus]